MACTTSSYDEIFMQPHSFATVGGVVGFAVGIALAFYFGPQLGSGAKDPPSGKMIAIICTATGAFLGAVTKMLWERFC
jgi:hypothetical protein